MPTGVRELDINIIPALQVLEVRATAANDGRVLRRFDEHGNGSPRILFSHLALEFSLDLLDDSAVTFEHDLIEWLRGTRAWKIDHARRRLAIRGAATLDDQVAYAAAALADEELMVRWIDLDGEGDLILKVADDGENGFLGLGNVLFGALNSGLDDLIRGVGGVGIRL